ncbi:hypothetical protein CLV63_13065 [Murinocardiopsis flavida]|uniref:Ava_C0101 and related proteins n=1 Tax=Murinocardiopsis flavida TaxID=645275 RepID=A0A2P8CT11_9ACTN|nr:DUF5996 family protein [Murinocardiopsis flavida]PSK88103.1 hypothetical protein CLV63_13065 [Murinocardiopsis flavida]
MSDFPELPLSEWVESKETLHRFLQVVGKIRLAASVRRNHWWNVPFHVTGRGVTSRPMGQADGNPVFTVDFDFVSHEVQVTVLDGRRTTIPLVGRSVAAFHDGVHRALADLGVRVAVPHDNPFDLPDAERPFSEDDEHAAYDPFWVNRYWQVLSRVNLLLEEFSAGFTGKVSPVHHFWHTFDIAATRFGPNLVEQPREAGSVVREAYSQDVVSSGFWFGDDAMPEPAFYSYTAPEPDGIAAQELRPAEASWVPQSRGGHLAILRYADVRTAPDPQARVLEFYESAYRAGARLSGWDVDALACPRGITDPVLQLHGR